MFNAAALAGAVAAFGANAVIDQLTDLPDSLEELERDASRNDRIRTEGTSNLVGAAEAAGARRFIAQSIAWRPQNRGAIVDRHERQVIEIGGVIARYGRLYGPDTYYEHELPPHPRIHVAEAPRATPPLLHAPSGIVTIADPL